LANFDCLELGVMLSDITLRQMEGFYLPRLIAPSIKICVERKFLFVGLYSLQVLVQVFCLTVSFCVQELLRILIISVVLMYDLDG